MSEMFLYGLSDLYLLVVVRCLLFLLIEYILKVRVFVIS